MAELGEGLVRAGHCRLQHDFLSHLGEDIRGVDATEPFRVLDGLPGIADDAFLVEAGLVLRVDDEVVACEVELTKRIEDLISAGPARELLI